MVIPIMVVVVFVGPVTFVHVPSVGVVIPVGVDVEAAFIRRAIPISGVPTVAALVWLPISLRPRKAWPWSRWTSLVPQRGRSLPDVNPEADLGVGRR